MGVVPVFRLNSEGAPPKQNLDGAPSESMCVSPSPKPFLPDGALHKAVYERRFSGDLWDYSACLVMFSSTPTQAKVTNSEEPP